MTECCVRSELSKSLIMREFNLYLDSGWYEGGPTTPDKNVGYLVSDFHLLPLPQINVKTRRESSI